MLLRKIYRYIKNGSFQTRDYLSYKKFLEENLKAYKRSYFNLTIDFELGWSRTRRGKNVTSTKKSLERSRRSKITLPVLLELSDQYKIPVTFAIVGHIAVNDYYGRDLVESIKNTTTRHEIASHSFSHIDFSDYEATKEIVESEIVESDKILRKYDPALSTFIFPNNHPAYLDLIKNAGFNTYRIRTNQKIKKDNYGLYQFPLGLWLSPQAVVSKDLINLISIAVSRRQLINFWCHLFEFDSPEECRSFFKPLFAYIESCQKIGEIKALTMRDIITDIHE